MNPFPANANTDLLREQMRSGVYDYTYAPAVGTYCYSGIPLGSNETGSAIYALPVSVAWEEDDLTKFDPPSAPITAMKRDGWALPSSSPSQNATITPAPSSSSSPAETPSATSPSPSPSRGGGFSTGAAAGTGVGVTVVAFAAIGVLWWYTRRHRTRRKHDGEVAEAEEAAPYRAEKDGTERYEADAKGKLAEAEGKSVAELDSGWQAPEVDGTEQRPAG